MATGFDTLVLDPDFIPLPDTTFVTNFDSDRNYILEITPVQGSGTIDVDSKSIHLNASGSRVATKITYFDGLGRPEQVVRLGMTTGHKDLIDYYQYDAAGREHKNWLPTPIRRQQGKIHTILDLRFIIHEFLRRRKSLCRNELRRFTAKQTRRFEKGRYRMAFPSGNDDLP